MTQYLSEAVIGYVTRLVDRGSLAERPLRIDGLSEQEIEGILPSLKLLMNRGRVAVLSSLTSEETGRIDADRATRYRNEIDATSGEGFVLLVPHGQLPESSLNEPAFLVVTRDAVFRNALARRRIELQLAQSEVEAIRHAARYAQAESVFAFLSAWDEQTGRVETSAPYDSLGLLMDSALGGSAEAVIERLRRNAAATEIIARPGLSPTRVLDELTAKLELDPTAYRTEVIALARWWQAGRADPRPPGIDFALWPIRMDVEAVEIDFEADLRLPPHRGWMDDGGETVVDPTIPAATLEWLPDRVPANIRYSVQLVEATTQEVVVNAIGGRSDRPRRSIRWTSVMKGALLDDLRALDPAGEETGFTLSLRLLVTRGSATLREYNTNAFIAKMGPSEDVVASSTSPTLYHALYQFHSEQRAESPRIVPAEGCPGKRLESENGRARSAAVDIAAALLQIEESILTAPDAIGPFVVRLDDSGGTSRLEVHPRASVRAAGLPQELQEARRGLFERLAGSGPIELQDWRDDSLRAAAHAYINEFHRAIDRISEHARAVGAVAAEDQLRCASLISADTAMAMVRDDQEEIPVLLVPPLHPTSLAWLIQFSDLVWDWTRGPFREDEKPKYQEVIEPMSVGPRTMAFASSEHGLGGPVWWGYGGNLSGAWQCFLPVHGSGEVRSRDWAGSLLEVLGISPRSHAAAVLDARRVGRRLKKYAVLHPYVKQLKLAALTSGDGIDLLDALKVMDESQGTPAGAKSVRDLRYEISVIGPRSPRLGSAIDAMVADPGQARWSHYANAIIDNPETVLVPGFAFARRPIDRDDSDESDFWNRVIEQLSDFKERAVHVSLVGPMLTANIATSPRGAQSLTRRGLAARPRTTVVTPENQQSPYQGDWVISIGARADSENEAEVAAAYLGKSLALAHGSVEPDREVGLSVKLAGPIARMLRLIHQISDWVIIADPLFSIELMDRRHREGVETVLLDYTPEFDPYPGGRVVVTTNSIHDESAIAAYALTDGRALANVLSSISARLLLALSNPTKQVVGGLRGLALTRVLVAQLHPGALVIPIDGHEDAFVSKKRQKAGTLADFVAVTIEDGEIAFNVFESKYSGSAAIDGLMEGGRAQARATGDVLLDEYIRYSGVDRDFRIEILRDIVLFHLERARRHGVKVGFGDLDVRSLFADSMALAKAGVTCAVVGWTPQGVANAGSVTGADGVEQWLMGAEDVDRNERLMVRWPELDRVGDIPPTANETVLIESGAPSVANGPEVAQIPEGTEPEVDVPPTDQPKAPSTPREDDGIRAREQAGQPEKRALVPVDPSCIRLGSLIGSDKPALWCPPLLSNGHLTLIGGSGAGKTTTLRHITTQLREASIPVLVLDFHGDITPAGSSEELYRFEYASNSFYVNPFHLDPKYDLIPLRLRDQFIEAWKRRYYSMGVQQYNFLVEIIDEAFRNRGITADPQTWSHEIDFGDVIEAFERSSAPGPVKEKIRAYIRAFREWRIFHGGSGIAIERFLEVSTRLDVSQLDEDARGILTDVVLRRLFLLCNALGPLQDQAGWAKFRIYVVIDEAQILMGTQGDAKASLSRYAAEARKFGIGLILATQLKDNIPEEIWGNIDTRIFMQALDPRERARNAKAAGVAEQTLQTLARGEGILTSSSQPMQRPLRIRIEPDWLAGSA